MSDQGDVVRAEFGCAFWSQGTERVLSLMRDCPFTFIVNRQSFESNLGEAVVLSKNVHSAIMSDETTAFFNINHEDINTDDFGKLLKCVRGEEFDFDHNSRKSVFTICRELGNPYLVATFVSAWNSSSSWIVIEGH
jgi:hypothetical protein